MVKIKNNNTYKLGDTVHWIDSYGTLRWGTIYALKQGPVPYAQIHEYGKTGLCMGAALDICWPTKEECLRAEAERSIAQVNEYKNQIQDVKDLVKFLFDTDVSSENRDYEAETAARERAKELLGIEIE